jgi:hypothetical protein
LAYICQRATIPAILLSSLLAPYRRGPFTH